MQVSKEEIIHIAKLANINLKQEEIDTYLSNLSEILNYANIVNKAPIDGLSESIGVNEAYNMFRKDEIKTSLPREELLQNAPEKQEGMFKIPKVING
jgi:aspartyl-tRNA(Asn)/glutamyl-tRNA(Gln) amidotransferase subunit C